MKHLSMETLARLVDERPEPAEAKHLAACVACAAELRALEKQTEALAALPEILPPADDWDVLEARLRSEGLVRASGLARELGLGRTPPWVSAAAAVLLFLGGVGVGAGLPSLGSAPEASTARPSEGGAELAAAPAASASVEEAAAAVRAAEQRYVSAVSRYRQLLERQGGPNVTADPFTRYAALEHLVSVSQAAVRQAPGDPFLNGFLASVLAERDAAARMVSAARDNWF